VGEALSTRQLILEAAYRCLCEKGSGKVSTRDVARAAGVTLSLIHYYFSSKEELLVAAACHAMERQLQELTQAIQPLPDVAGRVRCAVRFVKDHLAAIEVWRRVYFDLLAQAAWSPRIAAEVRKMQDSLVDLVVDCAPDDSFPPEQRRVFARVFLAGLNGLALQSLYGAPEDEIEKAYRLFEHMLLYTLADAPCAAAEPVSLAGAPRGSAVPWLKESRSEGSG
jgi:AcrR family transcriptional regulator